MTTIVLNAMKEDPDRCQCYWKILRKKPRHEKLGRDAKLALDSRANAWLSANPERLALMLQLARAGKTAAADVARIWLRRRSELTEYTA